MNWYLLQLQRDAAGERRPERRLQQRHRRRRRDADAVLAGVEAEAAAVASDCIDAHDAWLARQRRRCDRVSVALHRSIATALHQPAGRIAQTDFLDARNSPAVPLRS